MCEHEGHGSCHGAIEIPGIYGLGSINIVETWKKSEPQVSGYLLWVWESVCVCMRPALGPSSLLPPWLCREGDRGSARATPKERPCKERQWALVAPRSLCSSTGRGCHPIIMGWHPSKAGMLGKKNLRGSRARRGRDREWWSGRVGGWGK